MSEATATKPIFRPLNADDPDPEATEVESLCMNCHANGITRLLLTKIPFYKEVVLFSFSCEECGYQNNEIQSGGPVAEKGVRFTLKVNETVDLNRKVVKSDYTSVKIIELDFEIPAKSQKGEVTTVEGILDRSVRGLEQDQPVRRIEHPEAAQQIDEFINKLRDLKDMKQSFEIIFEDISGNTCIENPHAPQKDLTCHIEHFTRTLEQNHALGVFTKSEVANNDGLLHPIAEDDFTLEQLENDEVLQFPTNCTNCQSPCHTNMKLTNIPHFKEVVIMATTCDVCGHRTNEVKSGSGIEEKGLNITVKVSGMEDFSRDVLKSDTCTLRIPELDLDVGPTTLGGRFTTIEGLLTAIRDQLADQGHAFGDSQASDTKLRMETFLAKLNDVIAGKQGVTVILDDPAGNSYVQNLTDDDEVDEKLKITHYERTFDQNEELGLNDLKTENYTL
ncbi:Zpr1 [Carabus blaptoides fortunei]